MKPLQDTIHEEQVVYEDNHIIVVNKLPTEIVQGDKTGDMPLSEKIRAYLKKKYSKPGNVFCGVVHRLDRPVSGVVIFAKTSKALSRFNELIRERKLQKRYLAVIKRSPPAPEGHLVHFMLKNEKTNTSRAFEKPVAHALKAELKYKVLGSSDNYHLLGITLITGRHHQIRCQLSAIGCPIKGDLKYGFPRSNPDASLHLHSFKLEFEHPIKQTAISVNAFPLSDDPVWTYFTKGGIPDF